MTIFSYASVPCRFKSELQEMVTITFHRYFKDFSIIIQQEQNLSEFSAPRREKGARNFESVCIHLEYSVASLKIVVASFCRGHIEILLRLQQTNKHLYEEEKCETNVASSRTECGHVKFSPWIQRNSKRLVQNLNMWHLSGIANFQYIIQKFQTQYNPEGLIKTRGKGSRKRCQNLAIRHCLTVYTTSEDKQLSTFKFEIPRKNKVQATFTT